MDESVKSVSVEIADRQKPVVLRSSLRGLLTSRRLRPIWVIGGGCYIVFFLFRLGLFLAKLPKMKELSFGEVVNCFWVGLGFDSMIVGYVLLPLAILLTITPASAFARRKFRRLIDVYASAVSLYILSIEILGVGYFMHYGVRINWMLPYYIKHLHEVLGYVWQEYPLWCVIPIVPLCFYLFMRLYRKVFWAGGVPALRGWRRPGLAACVILFCVIACRGGFGSRPLNAGKPYTNTANQLMVELAKNNSYTFFYGTKNLIVEESHDEKGLYGLPDVDDAEPVVTEMLYQEEDIPLGAEDNPLWRCTKTAFEQKEMNVVLIVMESMAGKHVGALDYPKSQTPNLDEICKQGLFFSRMYAVGARTCRGLMGTLCGHPDLSGRPILDRDFAVGNFLTLPTLLQSRGYETMFIYGGRPTFDNMGAFLTAGGVETVIGQEQMAVEEGSTWGVPDEFIFNKAIETFDKQNGKKFFGLILTVSNHPPFDVPDGRIKLLPVDEPENKILNATRYADWALGRFFKQASKKPWFKNTVFVLVADTGRFVAFDKTNIVDAVRYRIPCVIYAPGHVKPQRVSTVSSQTDIAPTLMALLGGKYDHCFLGRNIMAVKPGDGFAMMHEDNRMAFIRGNRLLIQPPRSTARLYELTKFDAKPIEVDAEDELQMKRLEREMLSFYRMAKYLYEKGLYNTPVKKPSAGTIAGKRHVPAAKTE